MGREVEIEIEGDHLWIHAGRAEYRLSNGAFESEGMLCLNGDPRDGPWTLFPAEALTQHQRMLFIGLLCAHYGVANCKIPERPRIWPSLLADILVVSLLVAAAIRQ